MRFADALLEKTIKLSYSNLLLYQYYSYVSVSLETKGGKECEDTERLFLDYTLLISIVYSLEISFSIFSSCSIVEASLIHLEYQGLISEIALLIFFAILL